ncbi:hypothetical protein ACNFBR_08095 [Pseudomonas sp. NY11955]|uniref:hypothetical protein n=1 Tax=Pseudomonas sp. NY11955 TaxID=3400363 RepID=UPI003A8C7DCC
MFEDLADRAFNYVEKVNEALGVWYGINDVELKISPDRVCIIEQNGRMPGALVPKMIEACTDINCYDLALDIYLGRISQPVHQVVFKKHFCICCLISNESGVVFNVEGVEEVRGLASFHMMNLYATAGEHVEMTSDFLSSWGVVYLVHENLEILKSDSEFVHEKLCLQYC